LSLLSDSVARAFGLQVQDDPYEVLLSRFTGMGYSRDEAAMALVIAGLDRSDNADAIGEHNPFPPEDR
jgi:hypothetical protein